jgi:hypothetical protein
VRAQAVELIRKTTSDLIRKCKEMVDEEEMRAASAAAESGQVRALALGRKHTPTRKTERHLPHLRRLDANGAASHSCLTVTGPQPYFGPGEPH